MDKPRAGKSGRSGPRMEIRMSKQIACNDVVSGRPFEATAATEGRRVARVATRAGRCHDVKETTLERATKMTAAIR